MIIEVNQTAGESSGGRPVQLKPKQERASGGRLVITNMYDAAVTWNPFKGCRFDCSYCKPSFQKQAKRQKHNCEACYRYEPHIHPERLDKIPKAEIVFVCGNGDIAFCPPDYFRRILDTIKAKKGKDKNGQERVYYLQTKRPEYLKPFIEELPANVILVATLETNRDAGYDQVSKAPLPSVRFQQFRDLDYPRKVLTLEPLLDFDPETFLSWIVSIRPEYVWLGYNSRPKSVSLNEPSPAKVQTLADALVKEGIKIRAKQLKGVQISGRTI